MIYIRRESWALLAHAEADILELFECCYCYGDPWLDNFDDEIEPVEDDWAERQEPVIYGRVRDWIRPDGRVRLSTWDWNHRRQWPNRNAARIIQRQLDNPIDAGGVPGVRLHTRVGDPGLWTPIGLSEDQYIDTFTSDSERRRYRSERYVAKRYDKRTLERYRQSRKAREHARWNGV